MLTARDAKDISSKLKEGITSIVVSTEYQKLRPLKNAPGIEIFPGDEGKIIRVGFSLNFSDGYGILVDWGKRITGYTSFGNGIEELSFSRDKTPPPDTTKQMSLF